MQHTRVILAGLVAAVILFAGGSPAFAQAGATGQISGTVSDVSGGVLPGVDVTATQTDTGFKRSTVTDANGLYTLPSLPTGPYRLDVTLSGFRSVTRTGITLQVNSNLVIPVVLSLGELTETVTVVGEAPLVETRNLGVGQVMDNERIMELPLNGRNTADLLQYAPAAVPQPSMNAGGRSFGGSQGGLGYSIAGGLANAVTYVLDGASHNNPYDNLNLPLPFPDAMQEFRVETSALTAQNGMHTGAAVNGVTKSGTNQLHGTAFEFLRDKSMNASNPFNARQADGSRVDDGLNRNQYRRHGRRTDSGRSVVLFRRISGDSHQTAAERSARLRPDRADAGGRLHGVRLAGVQQRAPAKSGGSLRRQPDQSKSLQPRGPEYCLEAADDQRSMRALPVTRSRPSPTRRRRSGRSTIS